MGGKEGCRHRRSVGSGRGETGGWSLATHAVGGEGGQPALQSWAQQGSVDTQGGARCGGSRGAPSIFQKNQRGLLMLSCRMLSRLGSTSAQARPSSTRLLHSQLPPEVCTFALDLSWSLIRWRCTSGPCPLVLDLGSRSRQLPGLPVTSSPASHPRNCSVLSALRSVFLSFSLARLFHFWSPLGSTSPLLPLPLSPVRAPLSSRRSTYGATSRPASFRPLGLARSSSDPDEQ